MFYLVFLLVFKCSEQHMYVLPEYVSHERMDGDVIAIDGRSGRYFNITGTGADCWTLLALGVPLASWEEILLRHYPGSEVSGLAAFVEGCLQMGLLEHQESSSALHAGEGSSGLEEGLSGLEQGPAGETSATGPERVDPSVLALPPDMERAEWSAPVVEAFDDLKDLIRIDPIHDTSFFGWPDKK